MVMNYYFHYYGIKMFNHYAIYMYFENFFNEVNSYDSSLRPLTGLCKL